VPRCVVVRSNVDVYGRYIYFVALLLLLFPGDVVPTFLRCLLYVHLGDYLPLRCAVIPFTLLLYVLLLRWLLLFTLL
jgi:hypothetical protein